MGVDKSFHNASGYPLINLTKFPSMNAMTDKIHSLGLQAGWCELLSCTTFVVRRLEQNLLRALSRLRQPDNDPLSLRCQQL
jgi:hypothetical protein